MGNTPSSNLSTGHFAGWVRLASFGIVGVMRSAVNSR
jgi:hypothetical protein